MSELPRLSLVVLTSALPSNDDFYYPTLCGDDAS